MLCRSAHGRTSAHDYDCSKRSANKIKINFQSSSKRTECIRSDKILLQQHVRVHIILKRRRRSSASLHKDEVIRPHDRGNKKKADQDGLPSNCLFVDDRDGVYCCVLDVVLFLLLVGCFLGRLLVLSSSSKLMERREDTTGGLELVK